MTLREQLLEEIKVAPDNLLEELLSLCRERNESRDGLQLPVGRPAEDVAFGNTPIEAVNRLQAKLRLGNPDGQSLVNELIAERRSEAANE